MSLDADLIVDRRRMRRKLTFWRVVTVLVAIVAVVGGGLVLTGHRGAFTGGPGGTIARINIEGLIRGNRQRVEALDRLAQVERQGGDRPHQQPGRHRRRLRGALRLAGQASRPRSRWWWWSTGSRPPAAISPRWRPTASWRSRAPSSARSACIFQYPNVTELLKTIGVQVESIKSSPLKAAPSGYEPTSPEARAAVEAIVKDSYDWFKRPGARPPPSGRRELLQKVSDGRVFTGRQAVELKLIDGLGDEQAAIDWLAKEKNIDAKTPVRDYPLKPAVQRPAVPARRRARRARRRRPQRPGRAVQGVRRRPGGRAAEP